MLPLPCRAACASASASREPSSSIPRSAEADIQGRKRLLADHPLRSVPLVALIHRVLDERPDHTAPRSRFLGELEDHLGAVDSEHTLSAAIGWGRYAELFAYNSPRRTFSLDNPK
jgi:NitT/TauT family transport system ATP-binding protein